MIRTVLKPDNQDILIRIPKKFIGKQVEVIAFTIDEAEEHVLDEKAFTTIASENVLAKDWLTIEEDKAWQDL